MGEPLTAIPLLGIAAALRWGYESHNRLVRRNDNLEQVYRFSREVAGLDDADRVIGSVLVEAKRRLQSELAEFPSTARRARPGTGSTARAVWSSAKQLGSHRCGSWWMPPAAASWPPRCHLAAEFQGGRCGLHKSATRSRYRFFGGQVTARGQDAAAGGIHQLPHRVASELFADDHTALAVEPVPGLARRAVEGKLASSLCNRRFASTRTDPITGRASSRPATSRLKR